MDKDKAQKILFEVVDGEASALERAEFENYLATDLTLNAIYEFEVGMRARISQTTSAEKFPQQARAALLARLDAIDAESAADPAVRDYGDAPSKVIDLRTPRKVLSLRYVVAVAASFALMLVGGFATVSFFKHETAFGAFESAHYIARDMIGALADDRKTADATNFIGEKFGVGLADEINGLDLCGGEVVKLDDHEFAHFKFCDENDRPVSIFVGSAADYTLPQMPSTITAGKEYFRHMCHGCELMYWRSGEALIVAATAPESMESRPISSLITAKSHLDAAEQTLETLDETIH
ncbi:MAG TPA: hypothetical protein VLB27_04950 [candidate division Zixibacteria bacterium]|nr:hypothetical protein [candidate division Zixibacteria bacterium]